MEANRLSSPAALRNRGPILDILKRVLPPTGLVLELASGSGEHALHFAGALPALLWQPSDPAEAARRSIDAWRPARAPGNLLPALAIDAAAEHWAVDQADAVVCINMVHISPWAATEGLFRGAGRLLPSGAPLYLYGPYLRRGLPPEPSNAAFDLDLRRRNPRWGLRYLEDVVALAVTCSLDLEEVVEMPANNLSVVFRRR